MNRRKFIKTTSTAVASSFVLPRFSIAQSKKSANEKLATAENTVVMFIVKISLGVY